MKETILQYIQEYAPTVIVFIMMVIFKFGFGKEFSLFQQNVTSAFDTKKISDVISSVKDELESTRADLRVAAGEIKDLREEVKKEREIIQRVKGGK